MPIPQKTREKMNNDQLYTTCALYGQHGHVCDGRITREHAIIIAGKKCQMEWAIPPVCASGHGVDQFQDGKNTAPKDMREWCALSRATDKEIQEACGEEMYSEITPLSKAARYVQRRKALNAKYGPYVRQFPVDKAIVGVGYTIFSPLKKFDDGKLLKDLARVDESHGRREGGGFDIALPGAEKTVKQKWYPISHFDQAIIDRAKAHCKATGHFVGSDQTMIAIMIRDYGKELDAVEEITGPISRETP